MQDLQILASRHAGAVRRAQHVVSNPKMSRREHVFAVPVVLECSRFADQRIDHVAVVDRRAADPSQPRHSLDRRAAVADFDPLGADHQIDLLSDQPAGNRVGVAPHRDRAARPHRDTDDPFVRVELA